MAEKALSETIASGPKETASESAKVPATGPSGEGAASESTGEGQASEPQEPQASVPTPPTASATPAASIATKPAPPSEGDQRGAEWSGETGMQGGAPGPQPLHLTLASPQMSPAPRSC